MGKNTLQVAILNAILLMGGTMAYPATVYAQGQVQTYRIEAGDLESVLSRFGTQSRIQLIYPPDLLKGKHSKGLTGSHSPTEALRQILEGSGLEAERVNDSTVVIRRASVPAPKPQPATRNAPATAQSEQAEVQELEKLTVTGTRIRGGLTPSPIIAIGSERIAEEGFTNLGDVIRSVPQNYKGGQNPGVVTAAIGNFANTNVTGGSGLNLRGLGPDASLTLLNGRRLSYGGLSQSVDISAIPVEAVDRVEIVTDGASAIYGSDAVAGVGNVILKRDFDGMTIGANYGAASAGGLTTREATATTGSAWQSGGLIATYKYSSADPIFADQRYYTQDMEDPTTLYPGSDLRSGLISAYQEVGDMAEVRVDAFRTEREQTTYTGYPGIYYKYAIQNTSSFIAPSAKFYLSNDWTILLGGAWGKDETDYAIVSGADYRACYCNDSRSYEISMEGPLFGAGDAQARLALGAGYRSNSFSAYDYTVNSAVDGEGQESSRFAYAELSLPLIGPDSLLKSTHRLAISAAVRGEDYDSFGRAITPKLGVIYDPNENVTFKASWGKSFKAPTLLQRFQPASPTLYLADDVGGVGYDDDATVLMISGGNADLSEERATTWTTSMLFHPVAVPGMDIELTWFNIEYTDRVLYPIGFQYQGLSNPIYAEFVSYSPTLQQLEDILNSTGQPLQNYADVPYDPERVVAVMSNQYINVARQRISGLDLSGTYVLEVAGGRLAFRGSVSRLNSSQKSVPSQNSYDLAGTIFQPAKVNGRFGTTWSRAGFSSSAFVNHSSGVTDTISGAARKSGSFTTFDVNMRYKTGAIDGVWSGLDFALSVQNVFNRAPPMYAAPYTTYVPYDSSNYSAIGRFASISISKHW